MRTNNKEFPFFTKMCLFCDGQKITISVFLQIYVSFVTVTGKSTLKGKSWKKDKDRLICSNQLIQATIIILILVMAVWWVHTCLLSLKITKQPLYPRGMECTPVQQWVWDPLSGNSLSYGFKS